MAMPSDLNFHLNQLMLKENLRHAEQYQQAAELPKKLIFRRGRLALWMSMVVGLLGWGNAT